jgi:hypothetical protein
MLSFAVYLDGHAADKVELAGAYVVGTDDVPLRAEISFKDGVIVCDKRAAGPAGLAILWDVAGVGRVLLETVRVLERDKPYILQVEFVRARLMRLNQKLEDWGLMDFEDIDDVATMVYDARMLLIKALQADTPAEAAAKGDEALSLTVRASERATEFHANAFFSRRKETASFSPHVVGCGVPLDQSPDIIRKRISSAFDFVTVPIVWRDIEPNEQTFNWKPLDTWVEALSKAKIPVRASALLSFHERYVPEWLYVWEHDFDTIRDVAFEHVRRIINRYGQYVHNWDVISGVHANNCFTFTFEQLMELTRMTAALTNQAAPQSTTTINIIAPWGEYYARNQRTIPPLLYADMAVQSGINFDAFGLQFLFGPGIDGMFLRDNFQVSSLIDQFAKSGKTLHITALQVPSATGGSDIDGGHWREPWCEQIQAEWLARFVEVALSKPFVESVSWQCLTDTSEQLIPHGGLLSADLTPKKAYERLVDMRSEIHAASRS